MSFLWFSIYSVLEPKMNIIYEPQHDKTNKMVIAPSEDSDQPGHPPSLLRAFACTQWVDKGSLLLQANSEDSDTTGHLPRLIRVFAGCTCHFIGFVMRGSCRKILRSSHQFVYAAPTMESHIHLFNTSLGNTKLSIKLLTVMIYNKLVGL